MRRLAVVLVTLLAFSPLGAAADECYKSIGLSSLAQVIDDCTSNIESYWTPDFEKPVAFAFRGRAYAQKGQHDRAIQDLDQAIRLKPDYAFPFYTRGNVYGAMGQPDRAIQDFDQAIRLKPDYADAFNNRGYAYEQKGDLAQAERDYRQALQRDANNARAKSNLARLEGKLAERGQVAEKVERGQAAQAKVEEERRREEATRLAVEAERKVTQRAQKALTKLARAAEVAALDPGPADGGLGRKTKSAIEAFQKRAGLPVDGKPDEALVARIESAHETALAANAERERETKRAVEEQRRREEVERQAKAAEAARLADTQRQKDEAANVAAEAERKRQEELARRDVTAPVIEVAERVESQEFRPRAEGRVTDEKGAVELVVDGRRIELDREGRFEVDDYVAEGQQRTLALVATDSAGNVSRKTVTLSRVPAPVVAPVLARLDPSLARAETRPDAVALIIGISKYDAAAPASFADQDALIFKDYAELALGVPRANIVHLDPARADGVTILEGLKSKVGSRVVQGQSEVFVFFAGHGLTDGDGRRYLLPRDGRPSRQLLERSALRRELLVDELLALKPKHATLFLDTCFTGETRDSQALCDGCRLVGVRVAKEPEKPGLTIIAAAAEDQVSSALPEAKHGLFSYWLMKGLEGDADLDGDKAVTAKELHAYLNRHVPRLARGLGREQTPTLEGDGDVVLARLR